LREQAVSGHRPHANLSFRGRPAQRPGGAAPAGTERLAVAGATMLCCAMRCIYIASQERPMAETVNDAVLPPVRLPASLLRHAKAVGRRAGRDAGAGGAPRAARLRRRPARAAARPRGRRGQRAKAQALRPTASCQPGHRPAGAAVVHDVGASLEKCLRPCPARPQLRNPPGDLVQVGRVLAHADLLMQAPQRPSSSKGAMKPHDQHLPSGAVFGSGNDLSFSESWRVCRGSALRPSAGANVSSGCSTGLTA
jgi:hypothetical protein